MSTLSQILTPHTSIDMHYARDTLNMTAHTHDSLEICYLASGAMQISYSFPNSDQVKTVSVYKNQFYIIRPGVTHSQTTQSAHILVLELWPIHTATPADIQLANSEFISMMPSGKTFFQNLKPITVLTDTHEVKTWLNRLLRLIYEAQHGKLTEFYNAEYEMYLNHMFLEICKCAGSVAKVKYNRYIQYVFSFVQNNYGQSISVKQLADDLSLSPVYLNSIFKKETDKSIQDYIIDIRIQNAAKLLLEQNYTVTAIAHRVGYKNLRSFEIAFLKKMGISPTEYCRRNNPTGFVLWKYHNNESVGEDFAIYASSNDENSEKN